MESIGRLGIDHLEVAALRHRLQRHLAFGRRRRAFACGRGANHGDTLHPFRHGRQQGHRHVTAKREAGQPEALGQRRQQGLRDLIHRGQRRVIQGHTQHIGR